MAKRLGAAGPRVQDRDTWWAIFHGCFDATTREDLVALQHAIVTFEGGRWAQDFYGFWAEGWFRVMGEDAPIPPYPPGGPLLTDTPGPGPRLR